MTGPLTFIYVQEPPATRYLCYRDEGVLTLDECDRFCLDATVPLGGVLSKVVGAIALAAVEIDMEGMTVREGDQLHLVLDGDFW